MSAVRIELGAGRSFLINEGDLILIAGRGCWIGTSGYVLVRMPDGGREYLHRLIIRPSPGKQVDHVDGDRMNNTRVNLREVTRSQNLFNRGKASHNTTGYKGVYLCRDTNRFRAELRCRGKVLRLGRFRTPEDAARAYDAAAIEIHGEHARLNFPKDPAGACDTGAIGRGCD